MALLPACRSDAAAITDGTGKGALIVIGGNGGAGGNARGEYAVAISSAYAEGDGAIAQGYGASVKGDSSIAIGKLSTIHGVIATDPVHNAIALGNDASVLADGGLAFGRDTWVYATAVDGIALGGGSKAFRSALASPGSAYLGDNAAVKATVKGDKGALSVGNLHPADRANNFTRQITGVAAGSDDTDAVNVAQLKAAVASGGGTADLAPITQRLDGLDTTVGGHTTAIANHEGRITTLEGAIGDVTGGTAGAWDVRVEGNKIQTVNKSGAVNFKKGNNITITGSGADVTIAAVDAPTFSGAVTAGSIVVDEKTYIGKEGLNANGQTVTNVADAVKDGDAVNYRQLKAAFGGADITGMNERMSKLSGRVDSVGALASAFSALMPLDFDEDNRTTFAVGYGHYGGQNAVAIGAMHYVNRDALLNAGASFSGGETAFRFGASFRSGPSKSYGTARPTKGELDARAEIAELKGTVAELKENDMKSRAEIAELKKALEELKTLNK